MVVVYYEPVYRKYVASRCSLAWFAKAVLVAALLLLPYFVGWWTHSFWKKRETYLEQPEVEFTHKLVVALETQTPGQPLVFSTVPEVVAVVEPALVRRPRIETATIDYDLDGVADAFNLTLTMPLEAGEEVHRASLALFFELRLRDRIRMRMESLVFVSEQSPLPGAELTMLGDLRLRQLAPLNVNDDRTEYESPLLDPAAIKSFRDVTFPAMLASSFRRNETTEYDRRQHTYWTSGARDSFRVHAHVRVPRQPVEYVPEFWEVLKFAWVQYVAIFALFYYVIDLVRWFISRYQLVDSRLVGAPDTLSKVHQL